MTFDEKRAPVAIQRPILKPKFLLIAHLLLVAQAHALEPIRLHFVDRPPYAISHPTGDPTGIVATPASRVFKLAHIPVIWTKSRVNHIFSIIKENRGADCALGFEKTPSRSAFANFTNALYIGEPVVALTSLNVTEKNGVTLAQLLSKYRILYKEYYTLGDEITNQISHNPRSYSTTVDSVQMVQMVSQSAVDFMMISNEEITYFVKHGVLNPSNIRVLELPDVKIRFHRRLMCSKSVSDSVIRKLNAAISTLDIQPKHFDRSLVER